MLLTRDFKESAASRVRTDPAFASAILNEAVMLFVTGEPETAKLILPELVNAIIGFETLAGEIQKPPKSLHRMGSKSGNLTMESLSVSFAGVARAFMSATLREMPLVVEVDSVPVYSARLLQVAESVPVCTRLLEYPD